jgi:predicted LPLAT superfamily acyltransferase
MNENKTRQWTSQSIGSTFQHKIFYALIRIGGWRLSYFVLRFVVAYYILFRPSVRKKCSFYLFHRFPNQKTFKTLFDSYRLSLEFGKVLIDRAIVGILGPGKYSITFDDKEALFDLFSEGKGVILLMAHVGCWQAAIAAQGLLNVKINMVIHREEGDIDRQYFEHQSMESPYRVINPEGYLGGSLEMLEVLKKGEALFMMGDRVLGNPKNTVGVKFLGEEALFPFSAMKIASASGAPIAVLFPYKTGTTEGGLRLAKIIRVPRGVGRQGKDFLPYVTEFVQSLEAFTMEYPFQFFNFYDIWEKWT